MRPHARSRHFLDGQPTETKVSPEVAKSDVRTASARRSVPAAAGGIAIAIGALATAGWAFGAPLLESALPDLIAMQPVTALALVLSGLALLAAGRPGLPGAAATGFAAFVLLLALLDLGQSVSGVDFGIDTMLFPNGVSRQSVAMAHPGRMAEASAACFLSAALALFLVRIPGRAAASAFSAFATLILAPVGLTLLGYLLGTAPLPGIFGGTRISLPTAVGLGAVAIGLLALRPDAGWAPLLLGDTVGGGAARRLLPIVLLVPVAVGWLVEEGAETGLYPPGLALAIMTGLSIALLGALILWAAARFDRLRAILATEHELRESEHRLMQAQAELIHVGRLCELGAMGSALAHELNQPLAAIMNYLVVARRIVDAEALPASRDLKRALAHARASTERAAEIIRRLRAFVVKGEVEKAPHDLNTIVEDALVLAVAGGVLHNTGTEVSFDPAARWVLVDPIQIQQVLNNLLRNAVDAMEGLERREVTISTCRDGSMVEIEVADTGPGVADGDLEQVFTPFYSAKADGMGLGLSISRMIVEAHGGRIWAEPGKKEGAVFRFTLPAASAPPREDETEAEMEAAEEDEVEEEEI